MIIKINNLVLEGIHGLTEKEKKPQRFGIEVEAKLWSDYSEVDEIENTYDYRKIKGVIYGVVQGESCKLLEVLVSKIADEIIKNQDVFTVTVCVKKLDIWGNGFPSATVTRFATSFSGLKDFDLGKVLKKLMFSGAVSVPILSEERRLALLQEAEQYEYLPQPEIVGPAKVREQLSSISEFSKDSLFLKLKNDFTQLLNYKLALSPVNPFSEQISFNELSLQKYDKGSIGITPHKDNFSSINIIVLFMLKGRGDFALCDDREGSNPKSIDTILGNVIFMRGPKFFASDHRPFHFVTNIPEERIVFGMRKNVV
jgi:FolB domain-containing protein